MAATWESEWDDEEWLKRQSAATLRTIYIAEPPAGVDKSAIKEKIKEMMTAEMKASAAKNFADASAIDMLSYAQIADSDTMNAEITDSKGRKHLMVDILESATRERYAPLKDKDSLEELLDGRALLRANKIANEKIYEDNLDNASTDDEAKEKVNQAFSAIEDCDTRLEENKTLLESKLAEDHDFSLEEYSRYDEADRSGALDDISEEAKNAFINTLARHTGWDKIDGKEIIANDNALSSMGINTLDPYDKDGKLTPAYEQCADLLDNIKFAVDKGTSPEVIQSYKQQLLANAAARATNEILKDKTFSARYKTAKEILAVYQEKVFANFEHSVNVAKFTSNNDFAQKLKINKETGAVEFSDKDLEDLTKSSSGIEINPLTVMMDTDDLERENKLVARIFKGKQVDKNKLNFWQKAKKVVNAAAENIIKKGGWKKIAVNMLVYGSSAALMANPAALAIAAGTAMYATWTIGKAWLDKPLGQLSKEMDEKGIKGFKDRWKYRVSNIKRVWQDHYKNKNEVWRAAIRSVEGLAVAGVSGGLALGGAEATVKTLVRQGTMAVGKTGTGIWSSIRSKLLGKKYEQEGQRTIANFEAKEAAKKDARNDWIAAGSVIAGAAVADAFKFGPGLIPSENEADAVINIQTGGSKTLDDVYQPVDFDKNGNGIVDDFERPAVKMPDENGNENAVAGDSANKENSAGNEGATETDGNAGNEGATETESTAGNEDTTETDGNAGNEGATETDGNAGNDGENNGSEPEDTTVQAAEESSFNYSELSENEKRMYLNSVKKWDNNALATRIVELEKEGMTITPEIKDALQDAFGDNAFGKQIVQSFYDAIEAGKVESLPEGVSAVEYIDKLTRLAQLAPYAQRDAISIMVKDLLCEDFHPTDSEVALVKTALDSIVYEKGSMECIIPDANGNLCVKTTSMFGQYVGPQQMAQVEVNGVMRELPLRTANVTTGLEAKVNCEEGTGRIVSTFERHTLKDCGCIKTPPVPAPDPISEGQTEETEPLKPLQEIRGKAETNPDTRQKITLNFKNPYSEGTGTYAADKSNFAVEQTTADGGVKYMRMEKDGTLHLWQDNVDLNADSRLAAGGIEVEHHIPLSLNMNNLGAAKITDFEGVTTYQYGEGKNALVFSIDKESGIVTTTIGKQEVVLDQKTAQAALANIQKAAEEGKVDQVYNYQHGDEAEQTSSIAEYADKDRKTRVEEALNDKVEKAVEKASRDTTEVTYEDRQAAAAAKIAEIQARQAAVADTTANSSDTGIDSETKVASTGDTGIQAGTETEVNSSLTGSPEKDSAAYTDILRGTTYDEATGEYTVDSLRSGKLTYHFNEETNEFNIQRRGFPANEGHILFQNNVEGNVYSFDDNTYMDISGKEYEGTYDGQNLRGDIKQFCLRDDVYCHMMARQANGETLNDLEKGFMAQHEKELDAYGYTHGENGYLQPKPLNEMLDKGYDLVQGNRTVSLTDAGNAVKHEVASAGFKGEYSVLPDGRLAVDASVTEYENPSYTAIRDKVGLIQKMSDGTFSDMTGQITSDNLGAIDRAKDILVTEIAKKEAVYQDLLGRQSEGESLNAAERTFMQKHNETLRSYGLQHNRSGNLIEAKGNSPVVRSGRSGR